MAGWLHRTVAGLAPAEPGYRTLRVAPRPGPGITSASATHETPYGTASVSWTIEGSAFGFELVVPANSMARVSLPDDGESSEVGSGRHTFERTVTVPRPVDKPEPPDFSVHD